MQFAETSFSRNHTGKYSAKFDKCKYNLHSFLCQVDFISHKIVTGYFKVRKTDFTDTTATLM